MDFTRAQSDLDEANFLAKRSGMMLHECDCHLGYAHLFIESGRESLAAEHANTARQMVHVMGYHRIDEQLSEIMRQLSHGSDGCTAPDVPH
jgi:hypothetical protein